MSLKLSQNQKSEFKETLKIKIFSIIWVDPKTILKLWTLKLSGSKTTLGLGIKTKVIIEGSRKKKFFNFMSKPISVYENLIGKKKKWGRVKKMENSNLSENPPPPVPYSWKISIFLAAIAAL